MKLRGVGYAWNELAPKEVQGTHDSGFIADEMNDVLPDIVMKDVSGKSIPIRTTTRLLFPGLNRRVCCVS